MAKTNLRILVATNKSRRKIFKANPKFFVVRSKEISLISSFRSSIIWFKAAILSESLCCFSRNRSVIGLNLVSGLAYNNLWFTWIWDTFFASFWASDSNLGSSLFSIWSRKSWISSWISSISRIFPTTQFLMSLASSSFNYNRISFKVSWRTKYHVWIKLRIFHLHALRIWLISLGVISSGKGPYSIYLLSSLDYLFGTEA